MISNVYIDLTELIIRLLGQFKKPISLEEISFRLWATQSHVNKILSRLAYANVVSVIDGKYSLNKPEQFDLQKLLSR